VTRLASKEGRVGETVGVAGLYVVPELDGIAVEPRKAGPSTPDTREIFETSIMAALNAFQEWMLGVVAEATVAQPRPPARSIDKSR
jgi:hypothetical protein